MPKAFSNLICFLLLGALLPVPYGYFQFLRIVVFVAFAFAAYIGIIRHSTFRTIIFGSIAFLFNPIYPISFSREIWMLIDLGSAAILYFSRSELDKKQ